MAGYHSANTDEDSKPNNALSKYGEILFNRSGKIRHIFQGVITVQGNVPFLSQGQSGCAQGK
jgi:hypothetical protein